MCNYRKVEELIRFRAWVLKKEIKEKAKS